MNFALAQKAPITVQIDGEPYNFPPFVRKDWVAWASAIDAERTNLAMRELAPETRARFLLVYGLQPVDHAELSRRINTPEGTGRIIRTCGERGSVPKEVLDKLLDSGNERELETLAMMLASVVDPERIVPTKPSDQKGEEKPADPLPKSEPGSNA